MKAQELRIGNYYLYHIVDKRDERGEWDEVCQIDYDDLRILSEFDCPEYKPILLTKKWLLKFGFVKEGKEWQIGVHNGPFSGLMILQYNILNFRWNFSIGQYSDITLLKYVHQLQNLYFALTGEELTINNEL